MKSLICPKSFQICDLYGVLVEFGKKKYNVSITSIPDKFFSINYVNFNIKMIDNINKYKAIFNGFWFEKKLQKSIKMLSKRI